MITVENGLIVEEYDKFVNVGEPLDKKIIEITGITDDVLCEYGVSEKEIADDLKEKLTPETLMIAHNAQFDLSFIYNLLKRNFPDDAFDIVKNVNWIDTVTILKDRKDYPHKLIDAVKHYKIDEVNFHRAIDDTKALYNVTVAMKNERNDLVEYINLFGYNPKYGIGGEVFSFIEYKRQPYHNSGMLPPNRILPKL